ncbi:hypothetical protein [Nocardia sp. CC227C]|uniref:hypothetical protein n=1 Tax=Nocardia sp. CC227C TaxID=3044562 RepID=UPI00278C3F87|nr:hypothetical protein [Nocardia sp. CC227C]
MSFLLRRNLPLAWAGWYDNFERDPEDPVQKPWLHLGDGSPADINGLGELHIPSNYSSTDGGGESYAYQPFTPNWGIEMELWYPVEGLAAQHFLVYFSDSWTRIGAAFVDMCGIWLRHAPLAGGDDINVGEHANPYTPGTSIAAWDSPVSFYGQTLTLRIWIDNDEWLRVWLNNIYVGSCVIRPGFKFGPDRRCVRFFNNALCDVWMRWVDHYDRTSSIPPKTVWTSTVFADDFDRANGAVGNGWTQIGSNAEIVNNSWSTIGTTNGSRGLIRDTGVTSGRIRVEATVGGNIGPSSTSDSSLVILSNSAGTEGLAGRILSGRLYISRYSTALSDDPPTFHDLDTQTDGVAVASGDKVSFSLYGNALWIEINDTPKLYAHTTFATVPVTNSWAGLRVGRLSGSDSNSWNDVTIHQGV